jgi:hypothetical protein
MLDLALHVRREDLHYGERFSRLCDFSSLRPACLCFTLRRLTVMVEIRSLGSQGTFGHRFSTARDISGDVSLF